MGMCAGMVLKFFLSFSHSDEGWLHKAVEVEGQLHIIAELQVFEEQQPVNNVLISARQVASVTFKCTYHLCSLVFKLSLPVLDERVCGLSVRRGAAPLRQLWQIHFML